MFVLTVAFGAQLCVCLSPRLAHTFCSRLLAKNLCVFCFVSGNGQSWSSLYQITPASKMPPKFGLWSKPVESVSARGCSLKDVKDKVEARHTHGNKTKNLARSLVKLVSCASPQKMDPHDHGCLTTICLPQAHDILKQFRLYFSRNVKILPQLYNQMLAPRTRDRIHVATPQAEIAQGHDNFFVEVVS